MIAVLAAAAVVVCTVSPCVVVIEPKLSPVDRAWRDYEARQERIRPKLSPVDKAMRDFESRQRRLTCAAHPKQCD